MRPYPRLTNEILVVPLNFQVVDPVLTPNLLQRLDGDRALSRLKTLPDLEVPNRNPIIPVQRVQRMPTCPAKRPATPDKRNLINVVVEEFRVLLGCKMPESLGLDARSFGLEGVALVRMPDKRGCLEDKEEADDAEHGKTVPG